MNSVRSNNLSLKYQSFTPSGCKDIGRRKFEFVAKTQILYTYTFFVTTVCIVSNINLIRPVKILKLYFENLKLKKYEAPINKQKFIITKHI